MNATIHPPDPHASRPTALLIPVLFLSIVAAWGALEDQPATAQSSDAATEETRVDTLTSPYGPAVTDEQGKVEVWRLPALAKEDTFGVRLRYELREVEIEAERLDLKEIIRLAQQGEQRRRESVEDLTYTEQARVSVLGGRWKSDKVRVFEERARVYYKRPDKQMRIQIAEREYGDQDEKEEAKMDKSVQVEVHDALDFAQAPFYLDDIEAYRYEIHDRQIFPDRAIYAVKFEPRSDFDVAPTGVFWLDAADFVVIHEEMWFERNPAPLFLKSVDSIVRERQQVDGHWVVSRMQAKAEIRGALVWGFKKVEFEMFFTEFDFNSGLPDSIFVNK
jgi:hypothetical protein